MKIALVSLLVIIVLSVAYEAVRFMHTLSVSKVLISNAVPFQKLPIEGGPEAKGVSLLVLGDSTAVGVGASSPEESIAGRSANALKAVYVENLGVSGAQVHDLPSEIKHVGRNSYDVVIVQIGANDITHFHSPTGTVKQLIGILKTLPPSGKVIVMSAGDVGTATAVPWPLRYFYSRETLAYHQAWGTALTNAGYTYVNLYNAPRSYLFAKEPKTYLAADGFHPSSAGYGIWFEALLPFLSK